MLELLMEQAIASCPDLFIETGLTLIRRQIVINGRRPDLLLGDAFSRQLLVEIQSGRLDEAHLQRHFYYFYDYRAKFPTIHLRLMFIANQIGSQHKWFLDEHGYEYREIPEQDFERRLNDCEHRGNGIMPDESETVTTPGVLAPDIAELLYEIERQPMTLCYKMLLLSLMAELADSSGRVSIGTLAKRFHEFFLNRATLQKAEENPNRMVKQALSAYSPEKWERVIRKEPVRRLSERFLLDEQIAIRWSPRIWSRWNADVKDQIHRASTDRMMRYFD